MLEEVVFMLGRIMVNLEGNLQHFLQKELLKRQQHVKINY